MSSFNETPLTLSGLAFPLNGEGTLLAEALPLGQDPYAAQRAQTQQQLQNAFEQGPAAYQSEMQRLSPHWPWSGWTMARVATLALGFLLIFGAIGFPSAKVVLEGKGAVARAATGA